MGTNIDKRVAAINATKNIPKSAARDYITDMLAELCDVAERSGQEDLHILLKLTTQAARSATID